MSSAAASERLSFYCDARRSLVSFVTSVARGASDHSPTTAGNSLAPVWALSSFTHFTQSEGHERSVPVVFLR